MHATMLQGLVPDKALSKELNQARRTDLAHAWRHPTGRRLG